MRISHEAIDQALYIQGRGALRRELTACLRTRRAFRVPHARRSGRGKSFSTPGVMISERALGSGRPRRAGSLGGRLDPGIEPLGDRHAGRTHHALHHAPPSLADARTRWGAPGEERAAARRTWCRSCSRRHRHRDSDLARTAAAVVGLGPGGRDGAARRSQDRSRIAGLLLRSSKPVAAGRKREHQRPFAPVLPQGHRSQSPRSRRSRRRGRRPRGKASKDPRLENPRRSTGRLSTRRPQ